MDRRSPISDAERGKHVQFWADTHTTGGTAIDAEGNIYVSDPDKVQLMKIDPTGKISTVVADPRMLFIDEMWIDQKPPTPRPSPGGRGR